MKPSDRDYDLLANRLAEEISTDEQQLEELGAMVFTTARLIALKGKFTERLEQFDFWQKRLMKMAIWSPAFLVAGILMMYLGINRAGWFLIMLFPAFLVVCLAGVFLMYENYGSRGRIEGWLETVENELKRRRKELDKEERT